MYYKGDNLPEVKENFSILRAKPIGKAHKIFPLLAQIVVENDEGKFAFFY